MRGVLMGAVLAAAGFWSAGSPADAKIAVAIDKDNQQMTVIQDGVVKYTWPVSSGDVAHETPSGSFQTFRTEEDHYSKEFDDAPMPHAIFFTKLGHAIHGTDSVNRLGTPASHGCVRLSRANAATLYAMVKAVGVLNTTVTLTGSARVAMARNPRASRQVARRDPLGDVATPDYAAPTTAAPDYAMPGYPSDAMPAPPPRPLYQRRVLAPQVADDGYIYPSDGSGGRYPAPRGYRRSYDVQGYASDGRPYDNGYGPPQSYYRPGY